MAATTFDTDAAAARAERWLDVARWGTVVAVAFVMVSPTLANTGMIVMLVGLLASGQAGPRLRQACAQPLGMGTLILLAVIAAAMLWSDVPWGVRWDAFWSWRKLWVIPLALGLFGPLLWKRRLVIAYVAVCGVAVLISFGIVIVTGRLPTTVVDLAGSMLRNHSAQSLAFAAATFLALWLANDPGLSKRWRLVSLAFAALFVLDMAFVTPGRSGYVALVVMLVVLVAFSWRDRRAALAAGVAALLLAGAMAASPLARDRFALAWNEWQNATTLGNPTSMGIRAVIYENTLELIKERPWLGAGTGGFGTAYTARVKDKYDDWRVLPTADPHSQYLFFLAEQGIVGLLAFALYIGLALFDRGDGTRARVVAVGLLLGWCATSLLSSHFKTFAEGHLLAFFLGTMLARPVPRLDRALPLAAAGRMTAIPPPRRALVVTLRFLGDSLLSTPLVRAMKRRWPDCAIDVLVFAGTEGMFEGNPDVASVIAVDESPSAGDTLRQVMRLWRRYDFAVVAQTGTRPFLFGWAAGKQRIGLVSPETGKSWWKRLLLDRYAVFDAGGARVLENQRVAALIGIEDTPAVVAPSAGWTLSEISSALGFDATARYAVVHPSPRWRYKQWTYMGWKQLVRRLAGEGLQVVVTGGPGDAERSYLDRVLQGVAPEIITRVDGRWTLAQTADVLRHAALFVGPDTATTHLAAAVGTPTVALYGPTDPSIWGPWPASEGSAYLRVAPSQRRGNVLLLQNPALACVPCQREGCQRHRESYSECLDRLGPERVISAALEQARTAATSVTMDTKG